MMQCRIDANNVIKVNREFFEIIWTENSIERLGLSIECATSLSSYPNTSCASVARRSGSGPARLYADGCNIVWTVESTGCPTTYKASATPKPSPETLGNQARADGRFSLHPRSVPAHDGKII